MRELICRIASEDRRHYLKGVGIPANGLEGLVSSLGFRLVYRRLPGEQLGELDLEKGTISVNSLIPTMLHHNADPQAVANFTVAHELGHLSLHQAILNRGEALSDAHEVQAHVYAGVFLMPRSAIQGSTEWAELAGSTRNRRWQIVYALAERYRVTPKAMEVRICQLEKAGPLITSDNVIPFRRPEHEKFSACAQERTAKATR